MQKIPTWIVQTVAIIGVLAGYEFWIDQQQNNRLDAVDTQLGEVVTQLAVIEALQTERKEQFTRHMEESDNLRAAVAGAREDIVAIEAELKATNRWLEELLASLSLFAPHVSGDPPGGTETEKMN